MPLRAVGYERRRGSALATTDLRIRTQGNGLIGVCQENFLTASHNKASYVLRETVDSTAPKLWQWA